MSIIAQKYLVGLLGFALLGSVIVAGYQDAKHRKKENPAPTSTATMTSIPLGLVPGLKVFQEYGCIVCHGEGANHGAHNINAQTGQQIPSLIHVEDSYTKDELIAKIRNGVPVVAKLDTNGPTPPLYMPSFKNLLTDRQIEDLIDYLYSLKPKGEDLGF
jgi:mono/diheme cytochrome c family protein